VSLGVLAVLGLVGGLDIDGRMPVWRVGAYLVLAVLAYLHGRRVDSRFGWQTLAGVGAAGCVATAAVDVGEVTSVLFILVLTVVLPWLAGQYRRHLEREQEHAAERARLQERGRVAAELHDSLGHELALIALRAGAMELAPDLDARHRQAAGEIRASAVAATDQLRQVLAMLRDRDDVPPIGEIVARARDAGMTVRLTGAPAMPELVDQAMRRVVREALTNAARHAPGEPVTVRLAATGHEVTLLVTNPARHPAGRDGSGLVELRERVRLLGGRLDVTADDRFALAVRVPLT
jgi:signal transduction histidine kinase